MYGLENIGGQLKGFLDTSLKASVQQALANIPGYVAVSEAVRSINFRDRGARLGKRVDETVVDEGEMNNSKSLIVKELGGTWNPFKIVWNLIRGFLGSSSLQRVGAELGTLQGYAGLYDSQIFANDAIKFSLRLLQSRISSIEGWASKMGLKTNDKVDKDPLVQELKKTLKAWLEPFLTLLHGGIPGSGFSKSDWEFLSYISDQLRSGTGSKYTRDVLVDFEKVLQEAKQVWVAAHSPQQRQQAQQVMGSAQQMHGRNVGAQYAQVV
jgi:hypothetical protein